MNKKNAFPKANREITAHKVKLVDSNGKMLGSTSLLDALKKAEVEGLDLVEIAPGDEPVCKILDFSRFKYDAKKKKQEAKKKQKKHVVKEIKFKVNIGQGDFDVKVNRIRKFLEDGDKVKVSLWFKGREIVHKEKGKDIFDRVLESLGELAKIDVEPKFEGKQILMMLSPAQIKA